MEGGSPVYTPFVNWKFLNKTSFKVMAILPPENVILSGTCSRRDVTSLGSDLEEVPSCF